jgi:alpha-galactosidase
MLRSGMMGWLSIMIDTTSWDEKQHEIAKSEIQLYKEKLRPLIRDADLYHISDRPDGMQWDAIEYYDPHSRHGVVYAFRGSAKTETSHRFGLRGLEPASTYQLRFQDGTSTDRTFRGDELMTTGLVVKLPFANSSEIVFLEAVNTASNSSRH